MTNKVNTRAHPQGRGHFVEIRLGDGGWFGEYTIHAHGKSDAQITAEAQAIASHHAKKATRLTGFGVLNRALPRGYAVSDISIVERGTNAVELVLRVRRPDGEWIKCDQFYGSVDDIPSDAAIMEIAANAAQNHAQAVAGASARANAVSNVVAAALAKNGS